MNNPEQYWIDRENDVIGVEGVEQGDDTNQAPVYQRLAQTLIHLGVSHVLDVGCNVGQLAFFLRRLGFEGTYQGIDSNPFAIFKAQELFGPSDNYTFEEGNLRWLDMRAYSQMAVVSKDVLEHMEDPALFAKLLDVARRWVLIASFLPWTDGETIIEQHPDGYYMNRYNRVEMLKLAEAHHFGLVELVPVASKDGWQNQVALFERQPKDEPEVENGDQTLPIAPPKSKTFKRPK